MQFCSCSLYALYFSTDTFHNFITLLYSFLQVFPVVCSLCANSSLPPCRKRKERREPRRCCCETLLRSRWAVGQNKGRRGDRAGEIVLGPRLLCHRPAKKRKRRRRSTSTLNQIEKYDKAKNIIMCASCCMENGIQYSFFMLDGVAHFDSILKTVLIVKDVSFLRLAVFFLLRLGFEGK